MKNYSDEAVAVFAAQGNNQRTLEIITDLLSGESVGSVANRVGMPHQSVYNIKQRYNINPDIKWARTCLN